MSAMSDRSDIIAAVDAHIADEFASERAGDRQVVRRVSMLAETLPYSGSQLGNALGHAAQNDLGEYDVEYLGPSVWRFRR